MDGPRTANLSRKESYVLTRIQHPSERFQRNSEQVGEPPGVEDSAMR